MGNDYVWHQAIMTMYRKGEHAMTLAREELLARVDASQIILCRADALSLGATKTRSLLSDGRARGQWQYVIGASLRTSETPGIRFEDFARQI